MRVLIEGDEDIIDNVFIEKSKLSTSLVITTKDKWVKYDSTGWRSEDEARTWDYFAGTKYAEVVLIPEDVSDKDILDRVWMEQHNKDQLWILFLHESVYTESV